jgi:hypothetical protein
VSRRRFRIAHWWLCAAIVSGSGCAATTSSTDGLERAHPGLAAISSHRLGDVTPYLLPGAGEIVFFLCRWPSDRPIPVSLPPDADPDERRGLETVMRAWEQAGLGIRFDVGAAVGGGIEVRFIDPNSDAAVTTYAANTVADCAVGEAVATAASGAAVPAQLVSASILLWRGGFDAIGRPVRHSWEEFLGSALHEFGHALGFQGHAKVGGSVMVAEKGAARRAGARLESGRPFADTTLQALYAVPSGSVLQRASVPEDRTRTADRLARFAAAKGWAGPFVRVGDLDGFVVWRDSGGSDYRLRIPNVRTLMRDPARLEVRPSARVRDLLGVNPPSDRSPGTE